MLNQGIKSYVLNNSALFERVAFSKERAEILALAKDGQRIESARDVVKDPYVFEFLDLPDRNYRESELENRLIAELEKFLLELGKGFAFIGQQYRITLNNTHFFCGFGVLSSHSQVFCLNRSEDASGESSGYWTDEYVSKLFSS